MNLEQYVKEVRVNKTKMAKAVGCHRNHLAKVINGTCLPKMKLAYAICQYTNGKVTLEDLIKPSLEESKNQLNTCPEHEGSLC